MRIFAPSKVIIKHLKDEKGFINFRTCDWFRSEHEWTKLVF